MLKKLRIESDKMGIGIYESYVFLIMAKDIS